MVGILTNSITPTSFKMAKHPLCKNLDLIDLNNKNDLLKILSQDKYTRVEGLCSELVFMEDIVQNNLSPVTTDFWFTGENESYRVLTNERAELSELDYRILDRFTKPGFAIPTDIVYFNYQYTQLIPVGFTYVFFQTLCVRH